MESKTTVSTCNGIFVGTHIIRLVTRKRIHIIIIQQVVIIAHFKAQLLKIEAFNCLKDKENFRSIAEDFINAVAEVIALEQRIEFLTLEWMTHYEEALGELCPTIALRIDNGEKWQDICIKALQIFKERISFKHFSR